MLDLSGLNHAQLEAVVTTEGPLLVLAGAGSGKTRVITYRLAHLIRQGVSPKNILCVTFTNKAANEMKARARGLVGRSLRGATLSTFHALGVRILRMYGDRVGLKSSFGITDAGDQLGTIRRILRTLRIDDRRFDAKRLLGAITWAKNAGLTPDAFEDAEIPEDLLPDDEYELAAVEVYRKYSESLAAQNVVDFDDLLLRTTTLLEQHDDVRSALAERWRYLMVDEYQDTNPAQLRMLRAIARPANNLCVVGDDDQSIYGWRGADIRNILGFESHFPGARRITLDINYRSTRSILESANAVISPNPERYAKRLRAHAGDGSKVVVFAEDSDEAEAEEVANRLVRLQADDVPLSDVAVLYRSNVQSRGLQLALRHAHIPYRVVGGMDVFDRKELKDLLGYLRLLANPLDEQSLRRVVNLPPRGIGATTLTRIDDWARERDLALVDAIDRVYEVDGLSSRAADAVAAFQDMMKRHRRRAERFKASTVVKRLLEEIGYEAYLHEGSDDIQVTTRKVDNVRDLVRQLQRFERRSIAGVEVDDAISEDDEDELLDPAEEGALERFLSDLALLGMEEQPNPQAEPKDAVTLSTIHAAKGLEWGHVFVVGVEEELLPHRRILEGDGSVEEERRLAYVAITRARRELTISYARNRVRYGKEVPRKHSRFLEDLDDEHVERHDLTPPERTEDEKEAIALAWRAKIRAQLGMET